MELSSAHTARPSSSFITLSCRESGFFSYQLSSDWAVTTALLCAAAFPLVDPVAATAWRALLESAGGAELVANQGGSALVASVKAAAEQGDHAAVALHLLGSAGLGPAWEEVSMLPSLWVVAYALRN